MVTAIIIGVVVGIPAAVFGYAATISSAKEQGAREREREIMGRLSRTNVIQFRLWMTNLYASALQTRINHLQKKIARFNNAH